MLDLTEKYFAVEDNFAAQTKAYQGLGGHSEYEHNSHLQMTLDQC